MNFKGLKENDLIIQFGHLHGDNYKDLQQLSEVMKSAVGVSLFVKSLQLMCLHFRRHLK